MATGQSVLDRMEVLAPELQLQTGEANVTKGLVAANMAQDYLESVFAAYPGMWGATTGTVVTAASTETTSFINSAVLRLDLLQLLDSNSKVVRDLDPIYRVGGHVRGSGWLGTTNNSNTGAPVGYWTNQASIFWTPTPDAVYTVRWYGFQAKTDLTASGTFLYPDICLTPLATLAVRFIKTGLDDPIQQYQALADELFTPVIETLSKVSRERAASLEYRYLHTT